MLEIDGLTKRFGRHLALDAVSFQAQPGEVTAVVGPNGAGKTTLLSILVGVMKASAGRCEFRGMPQSEWSPARVGYLATDPFYYDKLTGIQMVSFERAMRRVDVSDRAVWELLEEFGATSFARRPMAELSQGMAKRIMLTCALMGEPRLVVLDEPLNALDTHAVLILKDQIRRLRANGCCVLVSSHLLDFVDDLADRVLFLGGGRLIRETKPDGRTTEAVYRQEFMAGVNRESPDPPGTVRRAGPEKRLP